MHVDKEHPDVNHRITMTHKKPRRLPDAKDYAFQLSAHVGVMDLKGEDDDGAISGLYNSLAEPTSYKPGFSDDRLCSERCFWKVSQNGGIPKLAQLSNKSLSEKQPTRRYSMQFYK